MPPGVEHLRRASAEKIAIVPACQEAQILAVMARCRREIELGRKLANVSFGVLADWKDGALQLMLVQNVENVGLIL